MFGSVPSHRIRAALGALAVIVGLGVVAQALERERLICDRALGTCTTTITPLLGDERVRVVALAGVVAHEFREGEAYGRMRGATVLTLDTGAEHLLAAGGPAEALRDHQALHAFFTGELARVERADEPERALIVVGVLVALYGAFAAVRAWTSRPPTEPARTSAQTASRPLRRHLLLAAVVAAGLMGLYFVIAATRAKLVLECQQRCEVNDTTCLPGQDMELWTDPGPRVIRVWRPDLEGAFSEHTVELVAGETTRFRCAIE